MEDLLVLTSNERLFLLGLSNRGVRFVVVGMTAALLQGSRGATEDIDLWFENIDSMAIREAAKEAGGFYLSGSFGMRPPGVGGEMLGDRFDIVLHMHGLSNFRSEYKNAIEMTIDDVPLRVLNIERVLASKRAANRPKDQAQIPAIETAIACSKKS